MKKNIIKSIFIIFIIVLGLSLTACSTRDIKKDTPSASSTNKPESSADTKTDNKKNTAEPKEFSAESADSDNIDHESSQSDSDSPILPNHNNNESDYDNASSRYNSVPSEEQIQEQERAYQETIKNIQNDSTAQEPSDVNQQDTQNSNTCSLLINCSTALDSGKLSNSLYDVLPSDGIIFYDPEFEMNPGESVFDILYRATRGSGIPLEFTDGDKYIEGINSLYEFDCGELSGWVYFVDGQRPNYGSDRYEVSPGSDIRWYYTTNLGDDVQL